MELVVLLAFTFFTIFQMSLVAADNPDGHFFIPQNYDARYYSQDCSIFYTEVGRSSFCCGDCWAHATAQQLGTVLCSVRLRPPAPLSAYDAVTCADVHNPCNGQLHPGVVATVAQGLTTGTNEPGKYGYCKRYRFLLCDPDQELPDKCPNAHGSKTYNVTKQDCLTRCDDLSPRERFGVGTDIAGFNPDYPISKKYMREIQRAIMSNGSVISAYWMGNLFKKTKNFEIFQKFEKDYKGGSNHYLLITGWGVEETLFGERKEYWILKNPNGGKGFGQNGYARVLRGVNLNSIETEIIGFKKNSWPPSCRPQPFAEVIFIEEGRIKCKSFEGRRCPSGCIATKEITKVLHFTCADGRPQQQRSVQFALICNTMQDY